MKKKQIFKHPLLAKLAQTNPLVAISLYYLISLGIIAYGIYTLPWSLLSGLQSLLIFMGGILAFTLVEYGMHRFVYHSGDNYKDEKNWQYKIHGVHHELPHEKDLLALPIPLAIVIASIFYMLFTLILQEQVYFFFPGFFAGYATYLYIHYSIHSRKPPQNIFKHLWKHHLTHHYSHDDKAFGVSSPLWDIIFDTMPRKASATRSRTFQKDYPKPDKT
jgi:sterol desaturase/sphingolipid hydroxylase (fatty acid hydroxylase superfamily)